MKIQNLRYRIASLMALFCLLVCSNAALAQDETPSPDLYLEVPTIESTDPVQVNIMLDNNGASITGYSFTISLPQGLSIVEKSDAKTDRFTDSQLLQFANNKFLVVSMDSSPFKGEKGSVGSFQIQATEAFLNSTAASQIKMTKINLAGVPVNGKVTSYNLAEKTYPVTVADQDPVELTLTGSADVFAANPGGSALVTLSLENNKILNGMQFDIVLPEGFTFDESGIQQSTRLLSGTTITKNVKPHATTVIIINMMENQILNPGEGSFVTFRVNVPETFTADDATIEINNIICTVDFKSYTPEAVTINLVNGLIKKNEADAAIAALQEKLDDAWTTITTDYADVAEQFSKDEIQTMINDLQSAVNTAYDDLTLTPDYDDVMAPASEIETAIDQLLADAKAAHDSANATDAAYNQGLEAWQTLDDAFKAAQETITSECPDVKDNFTGASISEAIAKMKEDLDAAKENGTIVEDVASIIAPQESLQQQIEKLVEDAKAAQTAFSEAGEELREAYENAHKVLDEVQSAFDAAIETINTEYADVADLFQGEGVKALIESLSTSIEEAFKNMTLAAQYSSIVEGPAAEIKSQIETLLENAKKADEAHDAEAAAAIARQQKHDAGTALVDQLKSQLADANTEIAAYGEEIAGKYAETAAAIEKELENMQTALDNALADKTILDEYDNLIAPASGIEAEINKMKEDAAADNKAGEDEALRKAENEAAYKADLATIAALEPALNSAKEEIKAYPAYDSAEAVAAIEAAIEALKKGADEAYAAVENEGKYSYDFSTEGVETMIADMIQAAKDAQGSQDAAVAAAKEKANNEVEGLQAQLAAALQTIKDECPLVAEEESYNGSDVQSKIDALTQAIEDADEAIATEEGYAEVMAPAAGIASDITALVEAAQAAQKAAEEANAAADLENAKKNADTKLSDLDKALEAALTEIETSCPDVKHLYTGALINQKIQVLRNAVNAAYADKTLATDYDTVMAPAADIEAAIEKLISDAQAAQADYEAADKALADAYAKALEVAQGLDTELAEALQTIGETCKDVAADFTGFEIEARIKALRSGAKAAYNDKSLVADYDEVVTDPATEISAAIATMIANAQAAQAAYEKGEADKAAELARQEAYNNAVGLANDIQGQLTSALSGLQTTCPDVYTQFPGTDIQNQIDDLKAAIEKANADKIPAEGYQEVTSSSDDIMAAIQALVEAAVAAQQAHDDDVTAKEEAYANANKVVDSLNSALATAKAGIDKDCADVAANYQGEAIQAQIDEMKKKIDDAYANGTIAGSYDDLVAPEADIKKAIEELTAAAAAAQKDFDNASAQLKVDYDKATEAIAALQKEFDDALATIAKDCDDVKDLFPGTAIQGQIDALKAAVDKALADRTLSDKYDETMAPATEISAAIAALIADAKKAQAAHDEEEAAEIARQTAYTNASNLVSQLQGQLETTLANIAESCPDVADQFNGNDIAAEISKMQNAIDAALADKTILDQFDALVAPAAGIEDSIKKLFEDASAAQAAVNAAKAANDAANERAQGAIADLQSEFDAALKTIADECDEDIAAQFPGTAIQGQIDALKAAVEQAYNEGTLADNYDNVIGSASTEISNAIAALIDEAKKAQEADDAEEAAEIARETAYTNASNLVSQLQSQLETALGTIAETCPDVKDQFPGTDIATAISNMQSAIDAAHADKTILDKFESLVAPATGIQAQIAKLVEDATAAQKAWQANADLQAARKKANDALAALDKALADALTQIQNDCPDVAHLYTGAAISQQITVLRNAVNAAYDEKTLADEYDTVMVPAASIEAQIAKMIEDAKAAQQAVADAEDQRQKDNAAAYAEDKATLEALREQLAAAKTDIEENCPAYDYAASYAKIVAAIDNLEAKVEKENEKVANAGNYSYDLDTTTVENMIDKMVEDAKAAQKAADDAAEAARKAANEAAYNADVAAINALTTALNNANAEIAKEYPAYDAAASVADIEAAIAALKSGADDAYKAVENEGEYSYDYSTSAVEAMIAKMLEDAENAQAAADEAARKEANEAAYNADIAAIEALAGELDAAKDVIASEYPSYDSAKAVADIQAAIDALKSAVEDAYKAVENEGDYDYNLDTADVEKMISDMLEEAKTSGIDIIFGDEVEAGARIFTLDGKLVPSLQHGKVNIIVKADGSRRKVMVK